MYFNVWYNIDWRTDEHNHYEYNHYCLHSWTIEYMFQAVVGNHFQLGFIARAHVCTNQDKIEIAKWSFKIVDYPSLYFFSIFIIVLLCTTHKWENVSEAKFSKVNITWHTTKSKITVDYWFWLSINMSDQIHMFPLVWIRWEIKNLYEFLDSILLSNCQ